MEGQARRTEYTVYRCRMFPCAIHTTRCHSQSIACWPFVGRNSQPHLPNFLFQRLRTVPAWRTLTLKGSEGLWVRGRNTYALDADAVLALKVLLANERSLRPFP